MDKELAASLGVDIRGLGRLLQTVSCTVAGGAGVLYGFIYKSFHLDFFTFALVGIAMTVIFVGGYATQWGTVVLAPILYGVPLLFPPSIQEWRIVIYGALLVLVLVLKPEGFITRRFVFSIESFLSGVRKKRNIL
jgi:branched-chain amino acid transport system permease protein